MSGINSKILWDRVPPEADPFSPDNLLIFGTDISDGTPVPAANRTVVTTVSPPTYRFVNAAKTHGSVPPNEYESPSGYDGHKAPYCGGPWRNWGLAGRVFPHGLGLDYVSEDLERRGISVSGKG